MMSEMIKCSSCYSVKSEDLFYRDETRNRLREKCKDCTLTQSRLWREANKERKRATDKQYRTDNVSLLREKAAKHFILNKDKYAAATAKRKASKLRATPEWLTKNQLAEIDYIYFLRKDASLLSDYEYHVDHIVPLQGREVCGLHVPWNLQLLPKEVNYAKNNRL